MTIKLHKNLTWKELKGLNDLYTKGRTQSRIQTFDYIKYLIDDKGLIERKLGNSKVLIASDSFEDFYLTYLKDNFEHYKAFFQSTELSTAAYKNYGEYDIRTLMFIKENKEDILNNLMNIRLFSSRFFEGKTSKYLENKPGLVKDVCQILGITAFPDDGKQENQWRFVVDCINPKAIILCENLSFLKSPWQAKKNNLKLWYVGGNNIKIIDDIDDEELKRPLYYSGDWDLAGLQIYSRVSRKFISKNKTISLLYPNLPHNYLPVDLPEHNSEWDFQLPLSGLNPDDFSKNEIALIQSLINSNQWLEEESNDLVEMMKTQSKL